MSVEGVHATEPDPPEVVADLTLTELQQIIRDEVAKSLAEFWHG